MAIKRSETYKAKMSIAAQKREALRKLERLGAPEPTPVDFISPSTTSTTESAETVGMPIASESDPNLGSPSQSIDLKKLRQLASAGNDIAACAAALNVRPEDIEAAISPTDWSSYFASAIRAGQAAIKLGLHLRAVGGDSRALDILAEQAKPSNPNDGCPRCKRLHSMTNAELQAEKARLAAVIADTPDVRLARCLAKAPTVRVLDPLKPGSELAVSALPTNASESEFINLDS